MKSGCALKKKLKVAIWPWLVLRKGWFNFNKGALVVVLGWPAGLNTSFIYKGLVLLQNLNNTELIICSKRTNLSNFFERNYKILGLSEKIRLL